MARKRQLDPEYPFEEEIAQLSIPARYFYILSWCHMSDPNPKEKIAGGVLPNNIFKLKGQIFPTDDINVANIIKELISMKRYFKFEADSKKWLWCPTMAKHQYIKHPSGKKYPDPPKELREGYRSTTVVRSQSRVELSRVELSKKAEPSPALTAALDKTYTLGFNIYSLINKAKKQISQPKDWHFPEEVILRVCEAYNRDQAKIKAPWPWFVKVLKAESAQYHAQRQINANKKDSKFGFSLKDLLTKGN